MDKLEQLVMENSSPLESNAMTGAAKTWEEVIGTDPAYVEVLATHKGVNGDRVIVEIDGVRIFAYHDLCDSKYTNLWKICESPVRKWSTGVHLPFLTIENLRPHLKRRRKRLVQRGLYHG